MSQIERVASNTPWEPIFGYVRKVKAGNWLAISGTTATDERGMIVGAGQMYVQARQAMLNLKNHIESAGFSLADVIRTRVFVTDISRFGEVARAHLEIFGAHPPASSLLEVTALVHPDMLIEVEADALRSAADSTDSGREIPAPAAVTAPPPAMPALKPAPKLAPKAAMKVAPKPAAKTPARPPTKAKASKPKRRK